MSCRARLTCRELGCADALRTVQRPRRGETKCSGGVVPQERACFLFVARIPSVADTRSREEGALCADDARMSEGVQALLKESLMEPRTLCPHVSN
jgi:hypothetical protein